MLQVRNIVPRAIGKGEIGMGTKAITKMFQFRTSSVY